MLRNYFKIAFRSLIKNPAYSFINIGGLAIGLASSILILLWVVDEYSYDRFHKNYNNIYKLYQSQQWAQGIGTGNAMPYPMKEVILSKSSQIKHVVITNWGEGNMLQAGKKRLNKLGLSVSEDFLKVFTFNMTKGNPETALSEPNSIVLTSSTAEAFFGNQDPINQIIKIDNSQDLKVTGVIDDIRGKPTEFLFDYLLPFSYYEATQSWVRYSKNNWENNSFPMYVQLQEGAKESDVNYSIKDIIKENNAKAPTATLFLHPMSKWRLYSTFENGKISGGMIEYVQLFTAIAVFVLIIACINFMNLATARSEGRAREVGIRKSIGSRRRELVGQFLGESILVAAIAMIIAIGIVELVLPAYNQLVNKTVTIDYDNTMVWIVGIALVMLLGVISGSYPAFYLSSFQPVKVLKGKVNLGKGTSTPRKVLVTLQFGFSIFLIIGTLIIYQQIEHVKNRDMGYNRENLIQIWTNGELEDNFQIIRDALAQTGVVESVCKSNSPITSIFSNSEVKWQGMPNQRVAFSTIATEYDYTKTMGIKMIEGRDFSRDFLSDSMAVVINQAAVDLMGLQDPIGQKLELNNQKFEIIGIMQNVVMASPYEPVEPMVLIFSPTWSSTITVRLSQTPDLNGALAKVEQIFKKHNPNYPFEYRFTDTDFEKKFASVNLISSLAAIFASLAILITCLGLLGLAAFTAEQRTKELGIRKVLGASVTNLVFLISKDFSRLVLFAFALSAPIAWWFLNSFLERYPYRVEISMWVIVGTGAFAHIIAILIVSTQAIRAAIANPVNSLRNE